MNRKLFVPAAVALVGCSAAIGPPNTAETVPVASSTGFSSTSPSSRELPEIPARPEERRADQPVDDGKAERRAALQAEIVSVCRESWPKRLAEARSAVDSVEKWNGEFSRVWPWFGANCRFLGYAERVVRKLDSEFAFVCRPGATGRPAGLTEAWLEQYTGETDLQNETTEGQWRVNRSCAELGADPVSLVDGSEEGMLRIGRAE